jgi:hypothetical protein
MKPGMSNSAESSSRSASPSIVSKNGQQALNLILDVVTGHAALLSIN